MITAILLFTVFVSFESLRTIHFRMITQCFDVSFETSRRYEVYMDDSSFTIGFHFDRLTLQVSDGKSFQRYPSAFIGKNWKQWRWQMRFFPGKFAFCRNYTLMIFFVGFPLNWDTCSSIFQRIRVAKKSVKNPSEFPGWFWTRDLWWSWRMWSFRLMAVKLRSLWMLPPWGPRIPQRSHRDWKSVPDFLFGNPYSFNLFYCNWLGGI